MKKNISLYENKGIALIMVLSILIILLILSLAIVSLSTGNLRTTGNVRARFEALNLATSAINYNMYDFNHMSTSIMTPYPPGATPTPLSSVPVHGPYNVTLDNTSLSQYNCRYIYAENLSNPNVSAADFSTYGYGSQDVPGNTIVIIGEGTYRGYKRVIRAVVRNNPGVAMGMCCDKDANLASIVVDPNGDSNSRLVVNGINDMTSCEPIAGSVQANKDLTFTNADPNSCRFYNGSTIRAVGTVNAPAVDDKHKVSNAAPVDIQEWKISDVVDIASCTPVPVVSTTPGAGGIAYFGVTDPATLTEELDPSDPNQISYRPESASLPPLIVSCDRKYVAGNRTLTGNWPTLIIKKNTKVNGNLVVYGNLEIQDGANLFINGVLEIKGNVRANNSASNLPYGGNIVTAGYRSLTGFDKGNSLEIKGQIEQNSLNASANKGNVLFSEGNIYINNSDNNNSNDWLYDQPLNVKTTIKALKNTGATGISNPGYSPNGIKDWWVANKSILRDPSQVGPEAAAWFNDPRADIYMDDTDPNSPFYHTPANWYIFSKNPSLLFNKNQSFFQGVLYSYGDITVDGPINLIGGAVTVKGAYTPPGSTGSIYAYRGGNIIANMEYMVGSKPFYRILTDVLSWCEL